MPLNIYTSNRIEKLVEALAGVLRQPLGSPLVPEVIVMQSKGMQRWLAMELARKFGVWANCDYPFPNAMVWRLYGLVFPDLTDAQQFSPEVMAWKITRLLPGLLGREEFAPLRHYLMDDSDGLKCFQLAEQIADTFDQYTLFRPEMLLEWEAATTTGSVCEWQTVLWRQLAAEGRGEHRGQLLDSFCRRVTNGIPATAQVPERLALFGISYLPKYHMDVLSAMAQHTAVNLFLLSPSREYWADIVSLRNKARLNPEERLLRMEGNPLLASLGKLGRDFSDMVIDIGDVAAAQDDFYFEPEGRCLLQGIQSDILNLTGTGEGRGKGTINPADCSIQIHSCHSPLREIEVLYDNILALLEKEPDLAPRDIVVMTPDIEAYAPYVTTVFEGCQDPFRKIPYSIADRSMASEGQIAAVVLKLLGLPGSRLTVIQLLDILEASPVTRRFDLDAQELDTIRQWLEETRIRWGMDERDRSALGLPGYRDNSWRAGLDRLLLGYAMPEEEGQLFNGKLPYDEMEGSGSRALGKLVEFVNKVAAVTECLGTPRSLVQWTEQFRIMLDDFVKADDDTARELTIVYGLLTSLGELGEQAGFGEQVELAVVRAWLSARLKKEEQGLGFMTGGVTFCAMLPMRSIPFRVVALIGMSDGAFPRQSRPPGFDLIARYPRRGDRSLRDEDRYLFLESILSARETLYISYIGQSIRDNSEIPPSVLVSEFLDAIDRGFTTGKDETVEQRLVTRHRLQPFSKDYFRAGSPLFSYSTENCAALQEKHHPLSHVNGFVTTPIAAPSTEWQDVSLVKLLRFFDNPAKFFLENRLGIRLEETAAPLGEREPFLVDGLGSYTLKNELLEIALQGGDPRAFLPVARCRGILPPARHGEALFNGAVSAVEAFAVVVKEQLGDQLQLSPLDFQLDVAGFRLSGRLIRIWPERLIRYRCAKVKAKDQVRTWIEHVVMNAVREEGYPRESILLMVDGVKGYGPVTNAMGILQNLLALYWQGLSTPLRYFPASAMEYARNGEWRLDRAVKVWEGGLHVPGEKNDPSFRLCFGGTDAFNHEFEHLSRAILEPLLQHQP